MVSYIPHLNYVGILGVTCDIQLLEVPPCEPHIGIASSQHISISWAFAYKRAAVPVISILIILNMNLLAILENYREEGVS